MSIRRFARMQAKGRIATYVHGGAKIGVLVDVTAVTTTLGKDIAMHVAATKPRALNASGVPAELVEASAGSSRESAPKTRPSPASRRRHHGQDGRGLGAEIPQARSRCSASRSSRTTSRRSSSCSSRKGATVSDFTLFVVGEGIEKKQSDFAAEVAAQVAASRG